MRSYNHGRFQQQASFLRRQFLQDGNLPFTNVLSEGIVAQALAAIDVRWLDRIYSPLVTLWVFLGQVLSADHSCRAAVARLIAHRLSRGERPCSAETGAYCKARKRLPEKFFSHVARHTGTALENGIDSQQLLERAPRLRLRRIDRHDARHTGEPTRVSATSGSATGPRLSHGADCRHLFAGLRSCN